jgi:hypothetical protein
VAAESRGTLGRVLRSPSPGDLWSLRAGLLEAGLPPDARTWAVIDEFRRFLDQLATGTSSREYSHLASKLDIGAVGGVVLEQLLEVEDAEELALRLLTGLLSEGLMVLATRQHVKAWEGELAAVYADAAWFLYGELWRWAERSKPDLPATERRRLMDTLLGPVRASETPGFHKAVIVGLLFQVLLVSHVASEAPHVLRESLPSQSPP